MSEISLKEIISPVSSEMKDFEKTFRDSMKTKVVLLDRIMNYIVKRKGKQVRPLLVFLSAGASGKIQEKTHRGAALIELLHTATLVHDDVVDEANYRRGFFSINALWKNKIAVLVGDFLLSKGLLLSIDNNDFPLLRIVSKAVREMSEGELLQIEKSRSLNITEDVYFEIIRQKTATLISACCSVGAASADQSEEFISKMALFGEKLGIAFQMKDDLFDYGTDDVGKPLGIDIKEKKLTLPLIYTLSSMNESERRNLKKKIKNHGGKKEKIKYIIDAVKAGKGLEYTQSKIYDYQQEALSYISDFKDSEYKRSLVELSKYIIERRK